MKKLLLSLTTILLFLPQIYASNIAGGQIEYESTGVKKWKIRLTVYRDCTGSNTICSGPCGGACPVNLIAKPTSEPGISSPNCDQAANTIQLTLNLVNVSDVDKDLSEKCPAMKNTCTNRGCVTAGTFAPSIEKYVFEGVLNLENVTAAQTCCYWDVIYENCCRSGAISTLQNPGGLGIRLKATLNACAINSSPILSNDPWTTAYGGRDTYYNPGASDKDGDSLSFEMEPPLNQGGTPVSYVPPFSVNVPLMYNMMMIPEDPNFSFNRATGAIFIRAFNPVNYTFTGVINIRIKQWRSDPVTKQPVLMGITQRDMQTTVLPSTGITNAPPYLPFTPGWPSLRSVITKEIPFGSEICFHILSSDSNLSDTTFIRVDTASLNLMTGATCTPVYQGPPAFAPREDKYLFCWKPTLADVGSNPHYFYVNINDNACPHPMKTSLAFEFRTLPPAKITGITKSNKGCRTYNIIPQVAGLTGFGRVTWKISTAPGQTNLDSNFVVDSNAHLLGIRFDRAGKYLVAARVEYPNYYEGPYVYDTVVVDSIALGARPGETKVCDNSIAQLPPFTSNVAGTGKWVYEPQPAAVNGINVYTDLLQAKPIDSSTAVNWIVYEFTAADQCMIRDSVVIRTYGHPAVSRSITRDRFCEGEGLVSTASVFNFMPAGGSWTGNGFSNHTFDPGSFAVYPATSFATYAYTYHYPNTMLTCSVNDTLSVYVQPKPKLGNILGNIQPFSDSVEVYTISNPGTASLQWMFEGESQVMNTSNTEAEVKWGAPGNGMVKVIAMGSNQCRTTDSITIDIKQYVGIKEPGIFKQLRLFPNPAQAEINIELAATKKGNMKLQLIDITGRTIMEQTIAEQAGMYNTTLNISHVPNGIYFINLSIGSDQVQRKINVIR